MAASALWILLATQHPVVAAFERFGEADPVEGGRLLIGELGCTACHPADRAGRRAPNLEDAGGRLKPDWIRAWLSDPRKVKPGTTMPHLLAGHPEAVEPLTHYLASLRGPALKPLRKGKKADGLKLFNTTGCAACHAPLGKEVPGDRAVVPLGDLKAKYAGPEILARFLFEPLKWRPSGRMPQVNLTHDELMALAATLAGSGGGPAGGPREPDPPVEAKPGLSYAYFEGGWNTLPEFEKLKPAATGTHPTFDIGLRKRDDQIAFRFIGYVEIPADGSYTFYTNSDDGSRLSIGTELVVDNDGIHGTTEAGGSITLKKGRHVITVEWFEQAGGEVLEVLYEGPGITRRAIPAAALSHDPAGKHPVRAASPDPAGFTPDPAKVKEGADLFVSLRCASCHLEPKLAKPPAARALANLKEGGCLAPVPPAGLPVFGLCDAQREAIKKALAAPAADSPALAVERTMAALYCAACHARGGKGGPEPGRDPFFKRIDVDATTDDLADEGRLPPRLDDVGAKIKPKWLEEILHRGTKVRPYMATRMPVFGPENTAPLLEHLPKAGREPTALLEKKEAAKEGRLLTGSKGLSCIVCHVFNGHKAQGIQAMDLIYMPRRLNREWFDRYMMDPIALRPGTRMPAFWAEGRVTKPEILKGDSARHIEALWRYLEGGGSAPLPQGLAAEEMLLVPDERPILYRNFIEGAGVRAIGVGYPERVHLAFDAEQGRLAMIWQGEFMDASKHWIGRGSGFQGPFGENVVRLPEGTAPDYAFEGYALDPKGRPTFLYRFGTVKVSDFFEPLATPAFKRTIRFEGTGDLRLRLAGAAERQADGSWKAGDLTLRVEGGEPAVQKGELLVPVGKGTLVVHYLW